MLDMRTREINLPDGVIVKCKPLETWAQQAWFEFLARTFGIENLNVADEKTNRERVMKLAISVEARELIEKILKHHVVEIVGLPVQDDKGTRNATIDDVLLHSGAYAKYGIGMLNGLMQVNQLTGTDVKNSAAPPAAS